jgi:hypothetical protein
MEPKIVSLAGVTILLTGVILIQAAHLDCHHAHPLHAPATAYTSVGTLVSSGVALDFRVQYASAIEALVDSRAPSRNRRRRLRQR